MSLKSTIVLFTVTQIIAFDLSFASNLRPSEITPSDSVPPKNEILEEVVVSSFRSNRSIRNLSAPIQVVNNATISNLEMGDIPSLFSIIPGVQMQSGTFQTTRIVIRGIGSRNPYGTNRTRAYFDDIPLTTGDGTTVVDDIELSFVDRVEITKGPNSAWYGGGMGGTIRFVTLAESNKPITVETNALAGSFGFRKLSANIKTKNQYGTLNVGIARHAGDGFRENSAFSRNSFFVSGKNGEHHKFNYLFSASDVKSQTPSSIDYTTFENSPSKAAANWLNVKGFKNYKRILGGLKSEIPLGKQLTNNATISGSFYDQYELRPFNILDDNSLSMSVQENIQYKNRFFTTSAGAEYLHEKYEWKILENNSLTKKLHASETRKQWNSFFNFETNPLSKWIFSVHGNLNSTHYDVNDLFLNDSVDYSRGYFNKLVFSPKMGLTYKPNAFVTLYTSAGHGFSNPTVEESLTSDGFFNSHLKPEQGWTAEIGSRAIALKNRLWMDLSVYTIYLNNLLVTKRLSEAVFYGENAGKSSLQGAEIQLTYQPNPYFRTVFSSSKSTNKFIEFVSDNRNYKGKNLPGIPNFNANIDMQGNYRKLQCNAIFTYTGAQFMDDANSVEASAWKTMNLRFAYTLKFAKRHELTFVSTIRNAFDEKYASMVLVNAPSFSGRMPRYYYPAMPRNFLFAIEMKL